MKKLLIVLLILLVGCTNQLSNQEIDAKYAEMEAKMLEYYDAFYLQIKAGLPEEFREAEIGIRLEQLKERDYDVSKFVNPVTNEPCSLDESFARIIQKPDQNIYPGKEYVIKIFYKCGDYTNEGYTPLKRAENNNDQNEQ